MCLSREISPICRKSGYIACVGQKSVKLHERNFPCDLLITASKYTRPIWSWFVAVNPTFNEVRRQVSSLTMCENQSTELVSSWMASFFNFDLCGCCSSWRQTRTGSWPRPRFTKAWTCRSHSTGAVVAQIRSNPSAGRMDVENLTVDFIERVIFFLISRIEEKERSTISCHLGRRHQRDLQII